MVFDGDVKVETRSDARSVFFLDPLRKMGFCRGISFKVILVLLSLSSPQGAGPGGTKTVMIHRWWGGKLLLGMALGPLLLTELHG